MSVLASKRSESSVEFINTANNIVEEVDDFLMRLSARAGRLYREPISKLAHQILEHTEKANSIYPTEDDNVRLDLREEHLLEARGALMALDVEMGRLYRVLNNNPQGCFSNSEGKSLPPSEARRKLDSMAQSLGEKIDAENALLTGAMKKLTAIRLAAKKKNRQ